MRQTVSLVYFADAYGKMNLTKPVKYFLNKLRENPDHIANFSNQSFLKMLSALNHISTFDETSLIQPILNYITQNHKTFIWEEAVQVAHFLAVHRLNQTTEFAATVEIINFFDADNLSLTQLPYDTYIQVFDIYLLTNIINPLDKKTSINVTINKKLELLVRSTKFLELLKSHELSNLDPIKNLIVNKLNEVEKDRFMNLLPSAVSALPSLYQPDLFLPAENSKIGIFVTGSELLSSDEYELSAINRFRFTILEKLVPQMICKAISYHQYLDINFKEVQISFKPETDINNILRHLIPSNNELEALGQISLKVIDIFEKLRSELKSAQSSYYEHEIQIKLNYIELFIKEIELIYSLREEKAKVFEQNQKILYNDKIKYQLAVLDGLYSFIPKNLIEQIDQAFKETSNFESFSILLHQLKQNFVSEETLQNKKLNNLPWLGVLLKTELPLEQSSVDPQQKNIDIEILNSKFLWDTEYHHYSSWKQKLTNSFTISNLRAEEADASDLIVNLDNGRTFNPTLIPNTHQLRNPIRPLSFAWNWEYYVYSFPKSIYDELLYKEAGNLSVQRDLTLEEELMVNLQNLKYQLKAEYKNEDIAKLLTDFEFIENLMTEHLNVGKTDNKGKTSRFVCPRDPKDYLDYLTNISKKWLFRDRYSNFFVAEGLKRLKVKSLKKNLESKEKELHQV